LIIAKYVYAGWYIKKYKKLKPLIRSVLRFMKQYIDHLEE